MAAPSGLAGVDQAAVDAVGVPFAGEPCQALSAADEAALKLTGTSTTLTTEPIPKTDAEVLRPASAAGAGCTWTVSQADGALAGTVSVTFESPTHFAVDKARATVTPTPVPTGLPGNGFVIGNQVEAGAGGYYFVVIGLDDPWASEAGSVASAVIAHL